MTSRGAVQSCDRKRDRLWVRFPPEEIKYLIFSFLCSDVEAKRGVEIKNGYSVKIKKKIYKIYHNLSVWYHTCISFYTYACVCVGLKGLNCYIYWTEKFTRVESLK